jgi:cytochrome c oxidase subunit 2
MQIARRWAAWAAVTMVALGAGAGSALADKPVPWQLGFQSPASAVASRVDSFHDGLLVVITLISVFVLGLLGYVILRFNRSRNPTPSKTSHNTLVEVVWTVVPVMILVGIAIPSFKLLYFMDRAADAEMTLKVTAHQWYWSYEYPDHGEIKFDSYMVETKDLKPGQPRLLETDNPVVLPVGTTVRVLIASGDVMHSWFVSALGVQEYGTPGRVNEKWVRVDREGTYYGQCNQICGIKHGFMPIQVQAVSKEAFAKWVEEAKKKFANDAMAPAVTLAQVQAGPVQAGPAN